MVKQSVLRSIVQYFDFCGVNKMVPTIEQLCIVLDLTPDELEDICAHGHTTLSHTLRAARETIIDIWKIELMYGNHEKMIRWMLEKYIGKKNEDIPTRTVG